MKTKFLSEVPQDGIPVAMRLRNTDMGRLLVRYGYEPYNTESAARRVAEKAAAELSRARSIVKLMLAQLDHGDYPENDNLDLVKRADKFLSETKP